MIVVGAFIVLLAMAVPIAFVLGLVGTIYIILRDMSLILVPQRMFVQIDSFVLMACPFFILAGALMNSGGFTSRLVKLCNVYMGHVRGGLAMVNVGASMFFAGISGSALADTAGIGGILIPSMVKEGYDPDFSAAITAASSTIGPIIPPSIAFVIYGVYAEVSVASLFIGGLLPGVLLGLLQMGLSYYYAIKRGYPRSQKSDWKVRIKATWDALGALMGPGIILGGILGGIFTPTEAGVVAVVYSFIVGKFIYKELRLSDLPRIIINSAITTASVFLVVATAAIFGWIIAAEQIPQQISNSIMGFSSNPIIVLLLMNLVMLFMGTWMDVTANLLILIPVFVPIITRLGIDPVFFGVVMVFNLIIGQITPPVGLVLFLACNIAGISLERLTKAIWPFILISIFVLLFITLFPKAIMWLPKLIL